MADDVCFSTLLKRWPIGDVVASEPLHHKGTVFLITTDRGARVILKAIGDPGQVERLMAEYRVLLHLQAAEVPVAVPLLAHDGRVHCEERATARADGASHSVAYSAP
jgi:Ser/Thr protein kinase RdoA (MazF antagonist)